MEVQPCYAYKGIKRHRRVTGGGRELSSPAVDPDRPLQRTTTRRLNRDQLDVFGY
jgi:hypothetical protein